MRDGEAADDLGDGLRLGAVALQELEARRRRGEEVRDLDPGAARGRRRPDLVPDAGLDQHSGAGRRVRGARRDRQPRDGADGRQRLAAEAERADARQVAVGQLRGGVALDREGEVLRAHAAAVVDDADELAPARLDPHLDGARAGVDGVLDELLHGRGRPLDDLAGGDAVDEDRVEPADAHHPSVRYCLARSFASSTAGWSNGSTPRA
jgi:hypothetical protein